MTVEPPGERSSRVPQQIFASAIEEQEAQLETNELLRRFPVSRQTFRDDRFRPLFHFVSPESRLNDPNGLCFWKGRWHLFYQGYPPEDPRQHWGHAVSPDLIHWRDLPYAIYPDPEECCFSGTTLVEDNRVIAIYHGTKAGNIVAVSTDPLLLNWEKLTGQAVIPLRNPDGTSPSYTVFDPCIWRKGNAYYSLSGGTSPHAPTGRRTRANFLLQSDNLTAWSYLHEFVEGDAFTRVGDDGACPYFWPIGSRHILLFFSHASGGQALLGDYDTQRDKFIVTAHHRFNFGPWGPGGVHAPSATPDGSGGVVVIFNMNAAKPCGNWDGIMSLPRRLNLLGQGRMERDMLAVSPAGDIESLRGAHQQVRDVVLPPNEEIVFESVQGTSMEIVTEIDVDTAPMIELNVFRSPNREEFTRIVFFRGRGYRDWERYDGWEPEKLLAARYSLITIDSSYSSLLPDALSRAPETAPVFLDRDEPLQLRVFLDRSVVEVFVNGRQCVALRVYPSRQDSTGVSIRAQGMGAHLVSLDAWQMNSIYP